MKGCIQIKGLMSVSHGFKWAWRVAMERVTSKDGTKIAYERSGTGPPLVLVHGTAADHTRWAPVLPAFQRHFTVYAVDRRGRGGSGDNAVYALDREFEDIAAVIDSIGAPVNLLGHSYGALCALEAAVRSPNVAKLALYEPAFDVGVPFNPPGVRERMEALLDKGDREGVVGMMFKEVVLMSDAEMELVRAAPSWPGRIAAAHTIPREFEDADYQFDAARFSSLRIPLLLLQGGDSPKFLVDATAAVHLAIPHSKLVVMPGQQHIAITTAPDMFGGLVLDFLHDKS
jgi:pimeloyl-ACP methyl ester carboxylesterase